MKLFTVTLLASAFMASAAFAGGLNGNAFGVKGKDGAAAPADHVDSWHHIGEDHQDNNNPGDTAADRHGFEDATAGGSGNNPTSGSSIY
jgi:hypothetical protein